MCGGIVCVHMYVYVAMISICVHKINDLICYISRYTGSTLVTGSKYGITKLWDITELSCTCTFTDSHTDEVTSIVMKVRLCKYVRVNISLSGKCHMV